VNAKQRAIVECKEGDEPLGAERKLHTFLAVAQLEPVKEGEADIHSQGPSLERR
jgi:hypothetical protein